MKYINRLLLSLAVLLLMSGVSLAAVRPGPAPVFADDSSGSSTSDNTSTTGNETTTEVETHGGNLAEQFKAEAQAKVAEQKANVKEQTAEHRQQACEARKANLTTRMNNAVAQAQRHKEVFDKIYARVKDFYTKKNLSITDYASLTAKVDTAQAAAATSISALKTLDISVDCTSQTVATSVSAFQTAVGNTRDSLKAYRAAIVDLINSIKGASTSTTTNSDNTTNTGAQ